MMDAVDVDHRAFPSLAEAHEASTSSSRRSSTASTRLAYSPASASPIPIPSRSPIPRTSSLSPAASPFLPSTLATLALSPRSPHSHSQPHSYSYSFGHSLGHSHAAASPLHAHSPLNPSLLGSTPPIHPIPSSSPLAHPASSAGIARPSKKATVSEMRTALERLGLDSRGKRTTLWKRLWGAFVQAKDEENAITAAAEAAGRPRDPQRQTYSSFLCFDVEATCEAGTRFNYPNEVIEFPVVLLRWEESSASEPSWEDPEEGDTDRPHVHVDPPAASGEDGPVCTHTGDDFVGGTAPSVAGSVSHVHDDGLPRLVVVDKFHSYVRPTWRPALSEYCVSLTGIQQATVDAAPTFPEMLVKLEEWLDEWDLRDESGGLHQDVLWVTDGPWDLRDFIPKQLHITPTTPRYPPYLLGDYLNLKQAVSTVLSDLHEADKCPDEPQPRLSTARAYRSVGSKSFFLNIAGQLGALGLGSFTGRQHSGIDDATNIARILAALAARGVLIQSNARLPPAANAKTWPWMGAPGQVLWDSPQEPPPTHSSTSGSNSGSTVPSSIKPESSRPETPEEVVVYQPRRLASPPLPPAMPPSTLRFSFDDHEHELGHSGLEPDMDDLDLELELDEPPATEAGAAYPLSPRRTRGKRGKRDAELNEGMAALAL